MVKRYELTPKGWAERVLIRATAYAYDPRSSTVKAPRQALLDEIERAIEHNCVRAWGLCADLWCPWCDEEDQSCQHEGNLTPECHEGACPELGR